MDSKEQVLEDNINISISFSDGSIGNIIYSAAGGSSMEKEYIEVFSGDKSAKLIDFKELHLFSGHKLKKTKLSQQDKGQKNEIRYFIDLITGKLKDEEYFEQVRSGSMATFKILESLRSGKPVQTS